MTVKITSGLPDGDANGLVAVQGALVGDPHQKHVVIALMDCKSTTTDNDTGDVTPTARVRRIEVVAKESEDGKRLIQLMRRAYEARTGKAVLPLDLEDDLREVFEQGE
jgi:hypothetical protein